MATNNNISSNNNHNNTTKFASTSSSHCLSTSQEWFPDFTHLLILEQSKYANIHIQRVFFNTVSQTCNFLPFHTVHLIHVYKIFSQTIFLPNGNSQHNLKFNYEIEINCYFETNVGAWSTQFISVKSELNNVGTYIISLLAMKLKKDVACLQTLRVSTTIRS